jgi:pimeloyl-ACP methyl ester carboxylesterase
VRYRRSLLILALLAIAAAALARPAWRAIEAAALLRGMAAWMSDGGGQSRAMRQEIGFVIDGRAYQADLYRSEDEPLAALLLVPGLAPDGKNDQRLVDLATVLARARFAVLVPDLASLGDQRVAPENIRQIADALRFMADRDNRYFPRHRPRGVAAISYAVGPALLATLQPATIGRIDFFVGIGGYYDVVSVVAYFTTGQYREAPGGPWRKGTPNEFGKWLFVAANAINIQDARDRTTLMAMAGRRMQDPSAPIDDLAALLGPQGQAVNRLLGNEDPERVAALIGALPARLRDDLLALSLANKPLAEAPARILLIHGRDDTIIPASESQALAAALPAEKVSLYLVDNLQHANLRPGGWRDIWLLWRAAYGLLLIRDGP